MEAIKSRFLVVDDHPLVREAIRELIVAQPDMTLVADVGTVEEALRVVSAEPVDVAVVDVSLGEQNGLDLVDKLRRVRRDLKILVLSMHDELLYGEMALRAGANGYLSKQATPRTILEALRAVLSGRSYVSPRMVERVLRSVQQTGTSKVGVEALSERELQIFRLIGMGRSSVEIGKRLHISAKTVETHRASIKRKLGVASANQLIVQAALWVRETSGGATA